MKKPYKYYYVLFVQRKHIFIIFLELFSYSLSNRSPPRNPKPKKIGINRHDGRKNNIAFYNSLLNRSMQCKYFFSLYFCGFMSCNIMFYIFFFISARLMQSFMEYEKRQSISFPSGLNLRYGCHWKKFWNENF